LLCLSPQYNGLKIFIIERLILIIIHNRSSYCPCRTVWQRIIALFI
jgi:hypothetical protein